MMVKNKRASQGIVRVTLDLTPEFYERLQKLCVKVGKTKASVLRDSLQLYEDVAEMSATGHSIVAVDKKGVTQRLRFVGLSSR